MATIKTEIKRPKSRAFRKLFVKRRSTSTGLFESTWQELTEDVKSWGSIRKSVDYVQFGRVRFSDLSLLMANDRGKYNPESNDASFWSGFATQQRTLVKIEAGFLAQTLATNGIWTNTNLPADPTIFLGVVMGDINVSDDNEVSLPVKPLLQVFRDYATRNLTGLTSTGMTAKDFINVLRDQTDGSANFVFRPFFDDTTTNWEVTSSSILYVDINSNTASARPSYDALEPAQNDFLEMTVWDAIETLAEAEDLVPTVTRDGVFRFAGRDANTTVAAFEFFGRGFHNREFGTTIKRINKFGEKVSDYYSRVELKWLNIATTTAVVSTQTSLAVSGSNNAWLFGQRTFAIQNFWIATLTSANSLANTIFATVSSVKDELDFATSFVPQLDILDRVELSYDSSELVAESLWDQNSWAPAATTTDELIWDKSGLDAISFRAKEFKITSINIDLDSLECNFVGIAL